MTPTSPNNGFSPGEHSKEQARVITELHAKGVDDDVITTVLGASTPRQERGRAEKLARARLRREVLTGRRHRLARVEPQAGGDVGAPWVRPDLMRRWCHRRAGR